MSSEDIKSHTSPCMSNSFPVYTYGLKGVGGCHTVRLFGVWTVSDDPTSDSTGRRSQGPNSRPRFSASIPSLSFPRSGRSHPTPCSVPKDLPGGMRLVRFVFIWCSGSRCLQSTPVVDPCGRYPTTVSKESSVFRGVWVRVHV